jgi:hypothetical protein
MEKEKGFPSSWVVGDFQPSRAWARARAGGPASPRASVGGRGGGGGGGRGGEPTGVDRR